MPERFKSGLLVGIVALSTLSGCSLGSGAPPHPVTEADVTGQWCGLPGEVVTLSPDHTFEITDASASFTDPFLHEDGYIDGYRVKTEFGGVRPTSLAGTWKLVALPTSDGITLHVRKIADREVNEGYGLGLEYDQGWRVTYSTDVFSPEAERLMSRCGSSGSTAASPP